MINKIFKITGMDCVACTVTIDGDLEDKEGVQEAKTNYAKSETQVTFDPEKVSEKDILSVLKKAGYTALPL